MWRKLNKSTYIYSIENTRVVGIIKRIDKNWQCYAFYSFGVYIYDDLCKFKKHAKDLIEMKLETRSWRPHFWMRYKIDNSWYKFKKNDKFNWIHNWTYVPKFTALEDLHKVSCFFPFVPNNNIIKLGFSHKEVKY